jgi:hypothetical protein
MSSPGTDLRSTGPFSYSGDPASSDADAIRFLVGDTNPAAYFLNDAEIAYLLAKYNGDVTEAAGAAAEAIAAELSREVTYSADGVSVSADSLAAKFYTVGEKIRTLGLRTDVGAGPDVGGIMIGEVYDDSIRPLVFSVGMHDNFRAGQQDFGGSYLPPALDYSSRAYGAVAAQARGLVAAATAAMANNVIEGPPSQTSGPLP